MFNQIWILYLSFPDPMVARLTHLIACIVVINAWNRFSVSMRQMSGVYVAVRR